MKQKTRNRLARQLQADLRGLQENSHPSLPECTPKLVAARYLFARGACEQCRSAFPVWEPESPHDHLNSRYTVIALEPSSERGRSTGYRWALVCRACAKHHRGRFQRAYTPNYPRGESKSPNP